MNINSDDAKAIVEMAEVCWGEGQGGPQGSRLIIAIALEFPGVVPNRMLEDAHASLARARAVS